MPSNESMTSTPAMGDFIAAAWRRRRIVLTAVVIGGVVGVAVVPLVTTNSRTYAASQRVDVKAFGSEKAPSAGTTTKGTGTSSDARYADLVRRVGLPVTPAASPAVPPPARRRS